MMTYDTSTCCPPDQTNNSTPIHHQQSCHLNDELSRPYQPKPRGVYTSATTSQHATGQPYYESIGSGESRSTTHPQNTVPFPRGCIGAHKLRYTPSMAKETPTSLAAATRLQRRRTSRTMRQSSDT